MDQAAPAPGDRAAPAPGDQAAPAPGDQAAPAPGDQATATPRRPNRLKAYEDQDFLRSPGARSLRVLAELLEPHYRLEEEGIQDTIVFFGSARAPDLSANHPPTPDRAGLAPYYEAARELARRLTGWSDGLPGQRRFVVCTGGGPGVMEAANRGAAEADGRSIGLAISLPMEEALNAYVTSSLAFDFHYFFIRKFWFVYNAKALIFFPGGYGTMDELMEVLTLVQTGKVRKKMGIVLYGRAFWNEVLNFDALVRHGVITEEDRRLFIVVDDVDTAFQRICEFLQANYGPSLLEEEP